MAASTTGQIPIGTIITARPWAQGVEQDPRSAIVIGGAWDGEFITVWFHTLGELSREDDGRAVQAIMTSKIQVTGSLTDWAPSTLKTLARRVKRGGHSRDVYVLSAIGTAYRVATERAA
jgi:hypothetical protein